MRLVFSRHAEVALLEREIERDWVERTIASPAWTSPDPEDAEAVRMFAPIVERGGRILRVVCRPDGEDTFIVTVFFDRGARRP